MTDHPPTPAELLRNLFAATLQQVDVAAAVERQITAGHQVQVEHPVHAESPTLSLAGLSCDLQSLHRIAILAIGKAARPMLEGAHRALAYALRNSPSQPLTIDALVISPPTQQAIDPNPPLPTTFLSGSHPSPDQSSRHAAEQAIAFLKTVDPNTLVLFLISGGASAMLELPLDPAISLEDTAAFHRALVGSGLPITSMNIVRKHFSAVKGGRLTAFASRAGAICTLVVSDVPDVPENTSASPLEVIGSGPSVPDTSTLAEARHLLAQLTTPLPATVRQLFADPNLPETPKPGDPIFRNAVARVILSSRELAHTTAHLASTQGFHVEIDNTPDDWDFREAAQYLLARSQTLALTHPRSCLISVGEVAVTLNANPGQGGRNQHFALYCALLLNQSDQPVTILSAGSDGIDGHSPAAGAIVDRTTVPRARALGLDPEQALAAFNAYPLFATLNDAILIGPTGNNLRDLRIFLTFPDQPVAQ